MTMTTMTGYDPYAHAAAMGIEVVHTEEGLRPQDDGAFFLLRDRIHLRPGMGGAQELCVFTHENAHAMEGHPDDRPKHEVIANRWAAEQLIYRPKLIELMGWTPDAARWAHELGVTTKIMQVYLNVHRLDLARGRAEPYRTRLAV